MLRHLSKSLRTHAMRIGWGARQVWHAGPGYLTADLLTGLALAGLPVALLYLVKSVIDLVTEAATAPSTETVIPQLLQQIAFIAVVALLIALLRGVQQVIREALSQHTQDDLQERIHRTSTGIDLIHYESPDYHNRFYLAQQLGAHRPKTTVQNLSQLFQTTFSLLAMAGVLATFSPWIAFVLLLAILPGIAGRFYVARDLAQWEKQRSETQRKTAYIHHLLTWHRYAPEMRAFQLGGYFARLHRELRTVLRKESIALTRKRAWMELGVQAGGIVVVFGAFAWVAVRVVRGQASVGDLVLFYSAFQRLLQSMQQLFNTLARLYEDSLFLSHLRGFLELPLRSDSSETMGDVPAAPSVGDGYTVQAVSFTYPGTSAKALEDLNLQIAPGEAVALVGENGSGKSTLAKVLAGLYEPSEGTVRWGSQPVKPENRQGAPVSIAYLSQDYARFYDTLRRNIQFGSLDAENDQARVHRAASSTGVDRIADHLEHGYEALLGKLFADGHELSEGQWQRVALARTLFREASILILDEPAAALDTRSELQLYQTLQAMRGDTTLILISHNIRHLQWVDRIYHLEKGRIVERGAWSELLESNGTFAELVHSMKQETRQPDGE